MTYKEYILLILARAVLPLTCSQIINCMMEMIEIPKPDRPQKKRRLYGPVSSELYRMNDAGLSVWGDIHKIKNFGVRGGFGYKLFNENN